MRLFRALLYLNESLMNKWIFVLFFCFLITRASAQSDGVLIRYPSLNQNGSLISFSFQGDIWTVPANGGKALRLTVHEAYESNPVFSPDGKSIAFSGARYGNNDIFTIPTDGGAPKRLTFHSSADNISSWTTTGNILFSTSREFQQIERPLEV
jgi:tricorn protease